jgi:solute carrier family 31 (copper transporter), member 1
MLNIKLNTPYALFFFILPILVLGHGDEDDATAEADMEPATEMSMGMGMMKTAFHFTPGDTLWFEGWVPTSNGGMFAACLALFLLSVLERGVIAIRGGMEAFWKKK